VTATAVFHKIFYAEYKKNHLEHLSVSVVSGNHVRWKRALISICIYLYYTQYVFCHGQLISVSCYKHTSLPHADIQTGLHKLVMSPKHFTFSYYLFRGLKRKTSYGVAAKVLSRCIIRGFIYDC